MPGDLEIATHKFVDGAVFCAKCGRNREDLISYGAPGACSYGDSGISCSGNLNTREVEELRAAYQARLDLFAKIMS